MPPLPFLARQKLRRQARPSLRSTVFFHDTGGWTLALIVWGYAQVSFLINDQVKGWLSRKMHPLLVIFFLTPGENKPVSGSISLPIFHPILKKTL